MSTIEFKGGPAEPATKSRVKQPLTARAVEIIKQRIKSGTYKPGEQLPSIRTLSTELELSHRVVQRAVEQLEAEAILQTRHGIGATVLDNAECRNTAFWFGFVQPYFSRFSQALQGRLEDALDEQSNMCVMKSSRNDAEREKQEIERLIASGINGLLIWPVDGDVNGAYLEEVSRRLPVVFVDRTLPDISAPSVVIDIGEGGRKILRRLNKAKKKRILFVCDPVNISTFNQLKEGIRLEAKELGIEDKLTVIDYPIIAMINDSYLGNYELADRCYHQISQMLKEGGYDALFCPQDEFFDLLFTPGQQAQVLQGVQCVTLQSIDNPCSRGYRALDIEEWGIDSDRMLLLALNLLQDMTLKRRTWQRTIRVPVTLYKPSQKQ